MTQSGRAISCLVFGSLGFCFSALEAEFTGRFLGPQTLARISGANSTQLGSGSFNCSDALAATLPAGNNNISDNKCASTPNGSLTPGKTCISCHNASAVSGAQYSTTGKPIMTPATAKIDCSIDTSKVGNPQPNTSFQQTDGPCAVTMASANAACMGLATVTKTLCSNVTFNQFSLQRAVGQ